ncbi:unnamed protein product [Rhizoctonia solani]|uniref:Uncharacterized protein n=1 Tax=Rhizoctonia solani TaxID=456999 RepID=A0A8H2WS19_9AGAM|nr:unnamed protein product [Rhizoctonia solani]CAE6465014.1 unnamed protein product [Rhizoctonia solani]
MSGSTRSTIKFALLAYSVYCWVDGSTRTQTSQNTDLTFDLIQELQPAPESRGWKAVWEWMCGPGSRTSEQERSALGRMDVVVSFFLFNSIQRLSSNTSIQAPSLLPPALPRIGNVGRIRWKVLVLTAALLSLAHETQRAAIIYYLRQRRTNQTTQLRKDLDTMHIGQITVQGDHTIPQHEDEDEEECLICSGSAETMSTSSHADNTMTTRMGPLEAFCTIAPQKHLAHRQCFLRWHAAYLQQSRHSLGNSVSLLGDVPTPLEQLVIRASVILQASGFTYLAPRLVQSTDQEPEGDSLTIHTDTTRHLLATLCTRAPPCPGCRSPVRLRFIDARPPLDSHTPPERVTPLVRHMVFSRFWRAWRRTVTGRTISAYFSSLLSFMVVLAAITRVRGASL